MRLSGFGGQGVILAGYTLGKAAAIHEDMFVIQTQSYGPAARGGSCKTDVIIGDEKVNYPRVHNADILAAFSQPGYEKFKLQINDGGGIILAESNLVIPTQEDLKYFKANGINFIQIPAQKKAKELDTPISANIVMAGAIAALTKKISYESIEKTLTSIFSEQKLEKNLVAAKAGYEIGEGHL